MENEEKDVEQVGGWREGTFSVARTKEMEKFCCD